MSWTTCFIVCAPAPDIPISREPWGAVGPLPSKRAAHRACKRLREYFPSQAFRPARVEFEASPSMPTKLAEHQTIGRQRLAALLGVAIPWQVRGLLLASTETNHDRREHPR
ncbi:hypothetical protein FQZ97_654050 [compost metagenome]